MQCVCPEGSVRELYPIVIYLSANSLYSADNDALNLSKFGLQPMWISANTLPGENYT